MSSTPVMRTVVAIAGVVLLASSSPTRSLAAQAPASQAPTKVVSVEGITEYRLSNGLRVLLFPDKSKPQTTVNVTYLVGSRHEGYGETGMAHLLEHMQFKGTPQTSAIPPRRSRRTARASTRRPPSIARTTSRPSPPRIRNLDVGAGSRGGPHDEQLRRPRGSREGDAGRAERVREG